MPKARRCPYCRALVTGHCDCARPSAVVRGYGSAWQAIRVEFLGHHPWCDEPGCATPARDVDHIVSRARGGSDDWSNLRGYCHPHHSAKTVRVDGGLGR